MKAAKLVFVLIMVCAVVPGCQAAKQADTDKADTSKNIDSSVIVTGNNQFAVDLYQKLRDTEGNLFFSPYSISTALAMTYAGARGRTESQMADVLHFPVSEAGREQFAAAFGKIIKDLNEKGKEGNYQLSVANALWGQKGYEFVDEFVELVNSNYDGRLSEVDFAGATEAARKIINGWVEEKTNDKIKELIKPGLLDAMTRLVLTNAIYFKGNWASQFEKDRTAPAPFYLSNGDKIEAAMMNQTGKFFYMQADNFKALELPYVEDELSMVVFLPNKANGLGEFEEKLTNDNLSKWIADLEKSRVEVKVSIPKFKMTNRFSLASVLRSMGMTDAFSSSADFSGMSGRRDLYISAVIHQAYVDVNEEGTEAAAATAVTMKLLSTMPAPTPVFRADHPFVFVIRDNNTGSVLFVGRVVSPNASE